MMEQLELFPELYTYDMKQDTVFPENYIKNSYIYVRNYEMMNHIKRTQTPNSL